MAVVVRAARPAAARQWCVAARASLRAEPAPAPAARLRRRRRRGMRRAVQRPALPGLLYAEAPIQATHKGVVYNKAATVMLLVGLVRASDVRVQGTMTRLPTHATHNEEVGCVHSP